MPIFKLLFLLFLLVPLLEIYLLLQVGDILGPIPTVGLVIFTAALGAVLLRIQGLQTLATVQNKLQNGEIPAIELIAGLMLLICGALLLTPGFFTDTIGFIVLIPYVRQFIAFRLLMHMAKQHEHKRQGFNVTIEGEYSEIDDRQKLK